MITRSGWGARPPKSTGNAISAHPKGVAIHYEGPKIGSRPHADCAAMVRGIQNFHMNSRGWADVAYTFMVCEHGHLFEGRGTGKGSAANGTTANNLNYYAICGLVGVGDVVSGALKDGIRDGIDRCRAAGAGSALVGHRDLFATACPGVELYAWVRAGCPRSTPTRTVTTPSRSVVRTAIQAVTSLFKPKYAQLDIDGKLGPATMARLGAVLANTYNTIKAVQRYLHVPESGVWDRTTILALQRRYGTPQDGVLSVPSSVIKAMQTRLNTNHF